LSLAVCKVHDLKCPRVIDQALDIMGDDLFRVNNVIDRHRFIPEYTLCQIGHRTNARDFRWSMKYCMSNLTGDHIDFIASGNGDEHIGVFCSSLPHDIGV